MNVIRPGIDGVKKIPPVRAYLFNDFFYHFSLSRVQSEFPDEILSHRFFKIRFGRNIGSSVDMIFIAVNGMALITVKPGSIGPESQEVGQRKRVFLIHLESVFIEHSV